MDGEKILEVISIYRAYLTKDFGPYKIDYPHDRHVLHPNQVLGHCYGMLDQMEEFVEQGRMDKAFRWLGFIQGCLWSQTCYTLEELKEHNRPDMENKDQ